MNDFSNEEYADMHLMYGLAEGNAAQAVRYYVDRFQGRRVSDRRTFIRVDRSLRETGSLPKPGGVGRPRQTRTVEAEEHVLQLVEENSSTSVRKLSSECNITKTIVHDILQEQLLHPYHIQKVDAMSEADYAPRVEFCTAFLESPRTNPTFISHALFTDEAGFTRDGIINCHNMHIWSDENPHAIIQTKHQQRFMINVWMALIGNYLIGPYIIDGTLNAHKYLTFLQEYLNPLLEEVPLNIRNHLWLMHDGAPPHFGRAVRDHLNILQWRLLLGRNPLQTSDPNKDHDVKYEDKEICEKCLLEALNLLSNRPTPPRQTQINFILNIAKYTSKDELCFINLNTSNVFETLIYLSQPYMEVDTKLLFMELVHSFLEHPSGVKWLMERNYWKDIFALTVMYQKLDERVEKIGYQILRIFLEKTVEIDRSFCDEVLRVIARRLLSTAQQIESAVLFNTHMLDGLKPDVKCLVEILEDLLKDYSSNVLQCVMNLKVGLASDVVSKTSSDMELCLHLDRITIILSFYDFTDVFDGIKSIQEDPLALGGFLKIIDREIDKGLFSTVFELYYYSLKYFKYIKDRIPDYSCKDQPVDPEDQLVALQLEPILLEWARLDGVTDILKETTDAELVSTSHPLKIFKNLCPKTLYTSFKVKEKLPACSFQLYANAVENIMRSKNLYTKKSLGVILDSLVYSLEAPLKYLQSKKNEKVTIEHEHQVFILALLEASLSFIGSFNLNWPDSIKVLDLLYIVIEVSSSYQWIEPIMLNCLILLKEIISRRYSPSMTLLIDTADGLKNIGPFLYTTCFTNEWKVRNAVLEVVHAIALSANKCFSSFKTILFDASLPCLVSTMALNDKCLQVRATALNCLQQIIVMKDVEKVLSKYILINKVLAIIMDNIDPVVTKEAVKLINIIYTQDKYLDKDVMMKIYRCLEQVTFLNSDATVQQEVCLFWGSVTCKYLNQEGWLDLKFPSITFSKRIISLTNKEVNKRFYKVLHELSRIGCLNVFKKFWTSNKNQQNGKNRSLECLHCFHYNFNTHKITPESMLINQEFSNLSSTQVDFLAPPQESHDNLEDIFNDSVMKVMPNDLEFINNEELLSLLDTNHSSIPSEVISERRITPSEFVELVYKNISELSPEDDSAGNDSLKRNDVYIIDY